ncbi:molybdate transport system substrate-binding protein [Mesorhizobium sp. J18]|uniref:molybdate ABC transporter substrate-binding protein n=1 Tax=Mesorhizobium sp. J18 TaxID=935263 RepID=UPI00119C4712|nr:molybdate ABC transporter substrate-binding protein [Mesorhizobium sp. J18]TWH00142.1 molybdate transport system substrate-binding protein [Mesorhizobium sp. J18]
MKKWVWALLLAMMSLGLLPTAAQEQITVFAAASMKDALGRAASDFEAESGTKVIVSFAASSVLARQIEAGAPADAFVSADQDWMEWLAERDLIKPETRRLIAGNALVIAVAEGTEQVSEPGELLKEGRFAMGDPRHVPAGKYAESALEKLGLWEDVKENAVFAENVRVALEFASRGETKAAMVYGSDLKAAKGLVLAYSFPAGSHDPVVYPAAATRDGKAEVVEFLDYLSGEKGQAIFEEFGFSRVEH